MKKHLNKFLVVAILIAFTSCNSTSNTTSTDASKSSQQTESRNETRKRGERPDPAKMFAEMDTNEDGKLSKDEVKGPLLEQFAKIDSNDDDFISKEELENAPKPERRGSQGGKQPRRN